MLTIQQPSENHRLPINFPQGIELYLKREDRLHPTISGNKFHKLKRNLIEAKAQGAATILTFGIIRGEELDEAVKIVSTPPEIGEI